MELTPRKEPQKITYEQYQEYTPEKIEMYENNVFFTEKERMKMLLLLLQNIGIEAFVRNLLPETRKELIEVVGEIEMGQKYLKVVEEVVSKFSQLQVNHEYQYDKQNHIIYIFCHLLDTNTVWSYSYVYDKDTGKFKEKEKFHAFACSEALQRLINK